MKRIPTKTKGIDLRCQGVEGFHLLVIEKKQTTENVNRGMACVYIGIKVLLK